MLNLFTLNDEWRVVIQPETLFLKPFKEVMDKYKNREDGLIELAYVYYMVDFRSDFDDIADYEVKSKRILESLDGSDRIKIDMITQNAIDFYVDRQPSISLRHLESIKRSLTSLQNVLDDINLTSTYTDKDGNRVEVYDTLALNRIAGIIKESPKIIAAVKEMEKQVRVELQESSKHRGTGEKSIYEDE